MSRRKKFFGACLLCVLMSVALDPSGAAASADVKLSLPQIDKVALPNGGVAFFVKDDIPLFSITASFGYGACYEDADTAGLGSLLAKYLPLAGSRLYPREKLSSAVEAMGGSIAVTSGSERTTVSITVLDRFRRQAMEMLADVIMRPEQSQEALAIAKELAANSIRQNYDKPANAAVLKLRALLFNGRGIGAEQTVAKTNSYSLDDIAGLMKRIFTSGNMALGVRFYGDAEEAKRLAQTAFAAMPIGKALDYGINREETKRHIKSVAGKIFLYHKDIPQSTIITGTIAPAAGDSDAYATEAMNYVLGSGGFGSRLFSEIRTKRGLAYSAYSNISMLKRIGVFAAFTQVEVSNTAVALRLMLENFDRMTKQPLTTSELNWVRRSIGNSYVFGFETFADVLSKKMLGFFYDLPADYYDKYLDNINAVTASQTTAAAERLFENGLVRVVVGPASLADSLSAFGQVEILNVNEN